ncbi:D-2-hydroxyacid dehydrogenase [Cohnella rhizosphaerae]|uniref:D-2-hydroxyacid dehydrogenase n=1 Tax=Cohnella rhizosphaerae TaxID=1457232 RepID=A0A9X4KU45_9BACL|nr:D-2-hydroxyacid dehydrogenase [Cohnella rhizosphaerae]MDG0810830.1 D-2-hydroxyacid dehydrogenase [Cohnella rhizosphaerae]
MRTIVSLFGFDPEQERRIQAAAPGCNVIFGKPAELDPGLLAEAEVLCGWWKAAWEKKAEFPGQLKWIQTGSAGVDNLPLSELETRGVVLTTASGVHPVPMTETVFAMLLAFTRKLHHAVRHQTERKWARSEGYGELRGLTLAVIGAGEIGTEVARIAQAFGMRTLGVRRSGQPASHVDVMHTPERLDDVLAQSDVVVNVLPHTAETVRLFDAGRFASMKPSALFINIGRGSAVDTEALTEALRGGAIAGAGLDVCEPEPLPADHPLWAMDNVILTPHIGGATERYKARMTDLFVENLQAYLRTGTPAKNIVDYEKRY